MYLFSSSIVFQVSSKMLKEWSTMNAAYWCITDGHFQKIRETNRCKHCLRQTPRANSVTISIYNYGTAHATEKGPTSMYDLVHANAKLSHWSMHLILKPLHRRQSYNWEKHFCCFTSVFQTSLPILDPLTCTSKFIQTHKSRS